MPDYSKESSEYLPHRDSDALEEFLVPAPTTLVRRMKTGAAWAFLVAGFAAFNLVLAYLQVPPGFGFSLGGLDFLLSSRRGPATPLNVLTLGLGAVLVAALFLAAALALRRQSWAFVAALVLVALDGAVAFTIGPFGYIAAALLHGFALYFLFVGCKAARLVHERAKSPRL